MQNFSPAAPVAVRRMTGDWTPVSRSAAGLHIVAVDQGERIEVRLPALDDTTYTGAQIVNGDRRALPLGSSLDAKRGIFYWPAAGGRRARPLGSSLYPIRGVFSGRRGAGCLGSFDLEFWNPSNLASAPNLVDAPNLVNAPNPATALNLAEVLAILSLWGHRCEWRSTRRRQAPSSISRTS